MLSSNKIFSLGSLFFIVFITTLRADNLRLIREKSFQAKDWENVYVNASGADVKVDSWDKAETYVKIFANRRAEDRFKFSIEQEDNTVKVIAKKRGSFFSWFGGGFDVRIEIKVPKNHNAHVETSGGDIYLSNLFGVFKLDTSGGDIVITNTDGKLRAETSGGDITLNKHKGEMNLSTSGGDIVCKESSGDISAETSGGDIKLEIADGKINAETSGGDIEIFYNGVNKGFEAETSGGDIHVKLSSGFKANAHFETSGGSIKNNFSNSRSIKTSRSEQDVEFNGGGVKLRLETSGGDIIVE
jgi:hypothetical protein